MKKRYLLLMALLASSASAQQNTDISAEQFTSGEANAQLSALGRQAAASGKRLVVTAPQHWHAQIAAKIRAGGNANVVLKDGFYETVLVRIEDKAEEPAKPEPKPEPAPVARAEPKRTPPPARVETAPVAPPPAPAARPPVAQAPAPTPAPAPEPVAQAPAATAAPPPAPAVSSAPPAVSEAPAAAPAAAESAVVDPKAPVMLVVAEPGDTDPARAALEGRYNEGKRITELVETTALKRADVIYAGKGAAVVVRREGNRILRMWLVGELNLNQIGISSAGSNKYEVLNSTIK